MIAAILPETALNFNANRSLSELMKTHVPQDCETRKPLKGESLTVKGMEVRYWTCSYPGGGPIAWWYGIRIDNRLFLVSFELNQEPERMDKYAKDALAIVQSIRLRIPARKE
jgi:hypothetical protein